MSDRLRTWLYALVFYTGSVAIVLTAPISALFGQRRLIAHAHVWARFHRWAARNILGITTRFEGTIPPGPVLFAAKHQAMYETLELQLLLGGPAVVLKRELRRIPVWGWATEMYGAIPVDRAASATALRRMMKDAARTKAEGRSVIVYPEGTRVVPGDTPPLRSGFAGLYKVLGLPVIPIALDSGTLLPRHGAKHPGVVRMQVGAPIPPGLPRREIEARVHAAINALN